jgi:hypothetical protein
VKDVSVPVNVNVNVIRSAVAVGLLALTQTGCASQIGMGRATTLEPGHTSMQSSLQLDVAAPKMRAEGKPVPAPWAHIGFGIHHGVARGLEIGGRAWYFGRPGDLSFGGAFDTKVQMFRTDKGLTVSAASSFGYHQAQLGYTPWHSFTGFVPILIGQDFGKHQLVFGPRAGLTLWAGEGQNTIKLPWAGASVGFSFGTDVKAFLMPELVVVYSPISLNGMVENEKFGAWGVQLGFSATYAP